MVFETDCTGDITDELYEFCTGFAEYCDFEI